MLPSLVTWLMLLLVGRSHRNIFSSYDQYIWYLLMVSSYYNIILISYHNHLMLLLVGRGHKRDEGAQLNLHRDSPWMLYANKYKYRYKYNHIWKYKCKCWFKYEYRQKGHSSTYTATHLEYHLIAFTNTDRNTHAMQI